MTCEICNSNNIKCKTCGVKMYCDEQTNAFEVFFKDNIRNIRGAECDKCRELIGNKMR